MKKVKNMIARNQSIITGEQTLERLMLIKDFPVFFGGTDSPREEDLVADMDWGIDPNTGTIQLTRLIPLDILYQEQHVDGYGPTWQQYYKDFSRYIVSKKQSKILEIGGGNGTLALTATEADRTILWTMVEPNPLFKGNDQIQIIKNFFDSSFKTNDDFNVVTFSQVMEHAYNPREFLMNIANFLKPGGHLIFAYPNLKLWLEEKFTNALNFEHTMFLTDYHLDYLLAKSGFRILDKQKYKDHSFFYDTEFTGITEPFALENKYTEYKKIFTNFIDYHHKLVSDMNQNMARSNNPTYLFGAHIFSTFLFAFGLNKERITSILDNSKLKIGRRLYGTEFMINSPEILRNKGKVNIILKAGIYNEEIASQILSINRDAIIW